jgi:N-acetylglutamate synthase-like GNAT family acetyltransferase
MLHAELREATEHDVEEILDIVERFVGETSYEVVFDRDLARGYIRGHVLAEDFDIIVAEIDGRIIGGVILAASSEVQVQPFCYVCKFFVLPEGRRSTAARGLLDAIKTWAEDHDCSHVFVTATAGLDMREQQLFINLMKRGQYDDVGPVLCLTLRN